MTTAQLASRTPRRWIPSSRRGRLALIGVTVAAAVAVTTGIGATWLSATATVRVTGAERCADANITGERSPADVAGICAMLAGMEEAWGAHDAAAYGEHFTPEATYTAYTGTIYQGRDDIAAGHAALFDRFIGDTRLSNRVISIHFTGEGHATMLTRGDTYTGTQPPAKPAKVQSYALTRQPDGKWLVAAFQNTQRKTRMERIQFLMAPETAPRLERAR